MECVVGSIDQTVEALAAKSSCADYPPLVRFGCDPGESINAFLSWLAYTIASLIQPWWPLLTVAAVLALAVGALLRVVLRRRRARESEAARFFEVISPYRLPAEGAAPLWRLLASALAEHGRRVRVALQLWADPEDGRVHAGLWVPGGVSAQAFSRAVARAWRGCGLVPGRPPSLPEGSLAACEVVPAEGPWAPLVDHQHRPERGAVDFEDEPLRGALEAMTEIAASGGLAAMQVIVSPTRGARMGSAARRRSVAEWLGVGLRALARGLISLLESVVTSGSTSSSQQGSTRTQREQDPVVAARQRAGEAKRKAGPHLRTTVRLTVAGMHNPHAARRQARELAATLTALAVQEHVTARKQVHRAWSKVAEYRHGRSFIASTRELAALWHLPHEPSRHGLPQPGAERRKPDTGLPRLDDYRHDRQRRDHRARGQQRDPRRRRRPEDHGNDDEDNEGGHNAA